MPDDGDPRMLLLQCGWVWLFSVQKKKKKVSKKGEMFWKKWIHWRIWEGPTFKLWPESWSPTFKPLRGVLGHVSKLWTESRVLGPWSTFTPCRICLQKHRNNIMCSKVAYFFKKIQTSRENNSRIFRIKYAKFSGYYFHMN